MADTRTTNAVGTWVLYGLLAISGLGLVSYYTFLTMGDAQPSPVLLIIGTMLTVIPAVMYPIARGLQQRSEVAAPGKAAGSHDAEMIQLLRSINDRMLLSDTAKRLAGRSKDREALRLAIREDLIRGDYDAAIVLVNEMSQTHGFREEAEEYRDQITRARAADYESKVDKALTGLQELLNRGDFEHATTEAAKIQRLFPDSQKVRELPRRVREAREQHKHALEREFLAASERDDLDRAMQLLKEMDKYLTEDEAAPYLETARGVISKQRQNYGLQFKFAVSNKDWVNAVQIGEQIIREFPNTKMADEVRATLDLLRERAAGQHAASPGSMQTT